MSPTLEEGIPIDVKSVTARRSESRMTLLPSTGPSLWMWRPEK
jgi:hypothetical protein